MADQNLNFSAAIDEWTKATQARLEAVFRSSVQDVVEEMQKVGPSVASTRAAIASHKGVGPVAAAGNGGHMPVDTGFLRASLRITKATPAPLAGGNPSGGSYSYDPSSVALTIAGLELGETVYASYTAVYARRINYGFVGSDSLGRTYNQRGYYFVDLAAQKWQQIVTANVTKLRNAVEAKTNGNASA